MKLIDAFQSFMAATTSGQLSERLLFASLELALLSLFFWLAIKVLRVRTARVCALLWLVILAKAALGGVVVVARLGSAFPNTATGMELRVITAVIVGGCSIYGGRGTVLGSALGVLFLAMVNNILVLNAVSVYWQGVASGCVLILAVLSDAIINRGKRS